MPSAKNVSAVKELTHQLSQAKAVIFTDYRGLSVAQMQQLRQAVKTAGGLLTVAKNTLIKIALKQQNQLLDDTLEQALKGPTALLLALEDEISPLKALVDFAQDQNLPTLKAGLLDQRTLTPEEISQLASLPTKDQLIAKLINQIQAPAYGLVSVLSGNFRNLVYVLSAISKKQASLIKNSKGGDN